MSEKNQTTSKLPECLQHAAGPLRYGLTNDYMFRAILQKNEKALRGLLSALLNLKPQEITSLTIKNPIQLGDSIQDKDCVLDIKLELNEEKLINIEMQVQNPLDWPERSLYYLCRNFSNLSKGEDYSQVQPVIHIGILNFTLFKEQPDFYSEYVMTNRKNGHIYSDKMSMRVLCLSQLDRCSQEEQQTELYAWAKAFKAQSWEELRTLAEKVNGIQEAVVTLQELTEEDKIRLQCEARDRWEFDRFMDRVTMNRLQKEAREAKEALMAFQETAKKMQKEAEEKVRQAEEAAQKAAEKATKAAERATQEAKEEAEAKAKEKESTRMNQLIRCLLQDGRTEDLLLASEDEKVKARLLSEYHID